MRKIKASVLMALIVIGLLVAVIPVNATPPVCRKPKVPSEDEIFSWIEDLWEIGYNSEFGWRMPGTVADHKAAQYVAEKFKEFGLENVFLEPTPIPVWMPNEWRLTVRYGNGFEEVVPSGYLPWASFTGPEGLTAQMVYVGRGTAAEFKNANDTFGLKGKIVLVDIYSNGVPYSLYKSVSLFTYDPDGVINESRSYPINWPLANMGSTYNLAIQYGVGGYVGILGFLVGDMNMYWHWAVSGVLPFTGLYVGPKTGAYLKNLLKTNTVEANILLQGSLEPNGVTYNVYGFLPGRTNEIILVESHHDGWATNDALGMANVMALAKYFAQTPKCDREKTILFLAIAGHFAVGKRPFPQNYPTVGSLLPEIIVDINLEMGPIKEYVYSPDRSQFVETGNVFPAGWYLSGPRLSANPCLLSYVIEAMTKHRVAPGNVLPANGSTTGCPGEGGRFYTAGLPIINFISGPAHQFTPEDTPDKVAKSMLVPVCEAFIDIINWIDDTPAILLKTHVPVTSVPLELYLGAGLLTTDNSYLGKGVLYVSNEIIYIGIDNSGWTAWSITQQWEKPNMKISKCISDWGTLWVYAYKDSCLAVGNKTLFIGQRI